MNKSSVIRTRMSLLNNKQNGAINRGTAVAVMGRAENDFEEEELENA